MQTKPIRSALCGFAGHWLFDNCIPRTAAWTLPLPLWQFVATVSAIEENFIFQGKIQPSFERSVNGPINRVCTVFNQKSVDRAERTAAEKTAAGR